MMTAGLGQPLLTSTPVADAQEFVDRYKDDALDGLQKMFDSGKVFGATLTPGSRKQRKVIDLLNTIALMQRILNDPTGIIAESDIAILNAEMPAFLDTTNRFAKHLDGQQRVIGATADLDAARFFRGEVIRDLAIATQTPLTQTQLDSSVRRGVKLRGLGFDIVITPLVLLGGLILLGVITYLGKRFFDDSASKNKIEANKLTIIAAGGRVPGTNDWWDFLGPPIAGLLVGLALGVAGFVFLRREIVGGGRRQGSLAFGE